MDLAKRSVCELKTRKTSNLTDSINKKPTFSDNMDIRVILFTYGIGLARSNVLDFWMLPSCAIESRCSLQDNSNSPTIGSLYSNTCDAKSTQSINNGRHGLFDKPYDGFLVRDNNEVLEHNFLKNVYL